jgi:U32 family peptidase
MQLITPQGNIAFTLQDLESQKGAALEVAPGSGHFVRIPVPADIKLTEDGGYALLMRDLL